MQATFGLAVHFTIASIGAKCNILEAMLDSYLSLEAFRAFALVAGFVMAVVSAAHWLAGYIADRLAMRVFALRYLLGACA
ncbi:hypothetical protein IP84_06865 [beta proteobacterium AAP99]|nr:hypothetical protein IP84_06865 [beta proteobacterium AAP99]